MDVEITVGGQAFAFQLDMKTGTWNSLVPTVAELDEGEFPLVAIAGGNRYELYRDQTFDEVKL